MSVIKADVTNFTTINILANILICILTIYFGYLADKYNRHKLLMLMSILLFLYPPIIYYIYIYHISLYYIAISLTILICAMNGGFLPVILSDLFSDDVKYSSIGLSYNIGFAVFGGITPLILFSSIELFNTAMAPAYIMMFTAVIMVFLMLFIYHKKISSKPLRGSFPF